MLNALLSINKKHKTPLRKKEMVYALVLHIGELCDQSISLWRINNSVHLYSLYFNNTKISNKTQEYFGIVSLFFNISTYSK